MPIDNGNDEYRRPPKPHPRAKFDAEEDEHLKRVVEKYGTNDWELIAIKIRGRTARQCRERWTNYLNPAIDNSEWTEEEDALLLEKHEEIGRHWKAIAEFFPNRTDIAVKNRWLMLERRRLKSQRRGGLIFPTPFPPKKEVPKDKPKVEKEKKLDLQEPFKFDSDSIADTIPIDDFGFDFSMPSLEGQDW